MNIYDATEQAYKNGYAKGYEDGKREVLEKLYGRFNVDVNEPFVEDLSDGALD